MKKKGSYAVSSTPPEDWQVCSDLETMLRCEEIEKDPKRLAAVQALAKKRVLNYASIASDSE